MRTVATVLGLVGGVRPRARASAVRRRRAATMIAYFRPRGDASASPPDGCGRRARGAQGAIFISFLLLCPVGRRRIRAWAVPAAAF